MVSALKDITNPNVAFLVTVAHIVGKLDTKQKVHFLPKELQFKLLISSR